MQDNKEIRRLQYLYGRINTLNHFYYNKHTSLVSDFEYDCLVDELNELETKYPNEKRQSSPTKLVGSDRDSYFSKVVHSVPMLSLQNTYNEYELSNWLSKLENKEVVVEEKIDGVALTLIYEKGELIRASTRGDGKIGDDITNNAMEVMGIIKNIPYKEPLEIRGEVYIRIKDFEALNNKRSSLGKDKYANTRNLASGTLKLHNSKRVSKRKLRFIAYQICLQPRPGVFDLQSKKLAWLEYLGFNTPINMICNTQKEIISALNLLRDNTNKKYHTDGAVIKVNEVIKQDKMGIGTKYPKWAIAYKFDTEKAITKIESIEFNVGRTGVVTPIANLKPISLGGTIVKRATLHNEDFIMALGISKGATVSIEKGGEIIPKVVKVHKTTTKEFKFPKDCPICGSKLYQKEGDTKWYCPDEFGNCTQLKEKISHFVSKKALDIMGLGEEIVNKLLENEVITNFVDLLTLKEEDLMCLEGFKHKLASKIIKSINKAFEKPMEKWLFALGIPLIGEINAKNICKELNTWYIIRKKALNGGFLDCNIENFGEAKNEALINWFKNDQNWAMIKTLKKMGMKKSYNSRELSNGILKGEIITITGNFGQYSRDFLIKHIENLGGVYNNSLKSNNTLLLMGDEVGKNKLAKAAKWNIRVLSKTESLKLLNI